MGKDELIVIVPAAGAGKRLGLGINKAFAMLNGAPLLVHCLHMLEATGLVKRAVVVLAPQEVVEGRELLAGYQKDYFRRLPFCVVAGGKERQDSVANALAAVEETDCYIAVHDGARPFAGRAVFERTLAAAKVHGAAIAAVPVKDTIKVVGTDGIVTATPERSMLMAVQTPQIFTVELLKQAYAQLAAHPAAVTDDASVVELMGHKVATALGRRICFLQKICWRNRSRKMENKIVMPQFRIGCGYDVHKLAEERKLIICGVEVPYEKGLLGHSDADVALHALMDALLGAAAMGDIGKHFPDTDERFKGADSMQLTLHVKKLLQEEGWQVNNVDVTIIAQRPKLAGYIAAMRTNVAKVLDVAESVVNIKATTTEKLGFTGRGEGIAAEAVASIVKM